MSLAAIRAGIKTALDANPHITVYGYERINPQMDCAVVHMPTEISFEVQDDDQWDYEIEIGLYCGLADDQGADERLCALIDEDGDETTSVIAALQADQTFGGTCSASIIEKVYKFGVATFGGGMSTQTGVMALTCSVQLRILT